MSNQLSRALKLALSLKKRIKDHYLVEATLVKFLYIDRDNGMFH